MNDALQNDDLHRFGLRFRPIVLILNVSFTLLFVVLNIWPLVIFYMIFSFKIGRLIYLGKHQPEKSRNAIDWIWLVVLTQSLLPVILIGPASGFQLHVLATIPTIFANERWSISRKVLRAAIITLFLALCEILSLIYHPIYSIDIFNIHLLYAINLAFTLVMLASLSYHLYLTIKEAEIKLRQLASTDPLTGLLNRRSMAEIADKECARIQRISGTLSLIICDIDYFKRINDLYGHDSGDLVLQLVSKTLLLLRKYDYVSRWGGEEFMILLPETNIEEAMIIAERLRVEVEKMVIPIQNNDVKVTLTLGVADLKHQENWQSTLTRADKALYQGKQSGRNRSEIA